MTKQSMFFWWVLAWQAVGQITAWTPTKADDMVVNALRTEEMFNEFWDFLTSKGWVTGNTVTIRKAVGVKLSAHMTPEGEAKITAA